MATSNHGSTFSRQVFRLGIALLMVTNFILIVPMAPAATIVVDTTEDEDNADGDCALREAVLSAVDDAAVDGCVAGSGSDEVIVPAGVFLLTMGTLPDFFDDTDTTIRGAGAGVTVIDGNAADRIISVSGSNTTTFLTIDSVTLRNGRDSSGGAVSISGGNLTLINSEVTGNTATSSGGGINNSSSGLIVIDSTISGNSAGNDGGGINNSSGTTTLMRVTVSGNDAQVDGGGLHVSGGEIVATNSTFDGNSIATDNPSAEGGGIFMTGGMLTGTNLTVTGNMAGLGEGGGVFITGATMNLTNVIIANNTFEDCAGNPVVSLGNNLDSDGSCMLASTGDLSAADPLLGALADNGGATATRALLAGSPAIDAGSNAVCPATDQRGIVRPQDGNDDATEICDIGAFEVGTGTPVAMQSPTLPFIPREFEFSGGDCVQFPINVAAEVPEGDEAITRIEVALTYSPLRGAIVGMPHIVPTPLRGANSGSSPAIARPALNVGQGCAADRTFNVAAFGRSNGDFLPSADAAATGDQASLGSSVDEQLRTINVTIVDDNGLFLPGIRQEGALFVLTFPIEDVPAAGPVLTFESMSITTTSAMGTADVAPFSGSFTLGGYDAFSRDGFEGMGGAAAFSYESQLFDDAGGTLTVGEGITGTLSLSHPIAARLGRADRSAMVVDYSLTDGTNTYTPQTSELIAADFGANDQGVPEDQIISVRQTPRATPQNPLVSGMDLFDALETGLAGDNSFLDFTCMEFVNDRCATVSASDAPDFGTSTGAGAWSRQ